MWPHDLGLYLSKSPFSFFIQTLGMGFAVPWINYSTLLFALEEGAVRKVQEARCRHIGITRATWTFGLGRYGNVSF